MPDTPSSPKSPDVKEDVVHSEETSKTNILDDAQFGGPEERARLEKRMLLKLDLRCDRDHDTSERNLTPCLCDR
jgi:hypothetical protein